MIKANYNISDFDIDYTNKQVYAGINCGEDLEYEQLIECALNDLEDWIGKAPAMKYSKRFNEWIEVDIYGLAYYNTLTSDEQKELLYNFFKDNKFIA